MQKAFKLTGRPRKCPHGPNTEKFKSGHCKRCERARRQEPKRAAYRAAYHAANRLRLNEARRKRVGINAAKASRRRARKRAALCGCCAPAVFAELFKFAAAVRCHVDHVTPLAAGGLHCIHNLQVLTPEQHIEKTKQDLKVIALFRHNSAE